MQFSNSFVLAVLAASAQAAVTAQQMTSNIDAITDLSEKTNNIAKSISVTNFFSTTPQVINNFRQIVQVASDDISAMEKRWMHSKRQECLNVQDVQKCIEDLNEIIEDPSEILGDKKRSFIGSPSARTVIARQSTSYTQAEQEAICSSFRGVRDSLVLCCASLANDYSLSPFTSSYLAL